MQYSFFQKLYLPFFSSDYYRHVVAERKGLGLKTFFGVLTLNWLVTLLLFLGGIIWLFQQKHLINTYQEVINQFPVLTIQNGKLSIQEPTPYVINWVDDEGKEIPFIVIDTSEQPQIPEELQKGVDIIITNDQLVVKNSAYESRTYKFDQLEDMVITYEMIDAFLRSFSVLFVAIFIFGAILCSYLFRLFQVFIYALFGMILAAIFNVSLTYEQLCRLATTALIPILVLDLVLFFVWSGKQLWFFNFLLAMIFLGYGISSQKKNPPLPVSW